MVKSRSWMAISALLGEDSSRPTYLASTLGRDRIAAVATEIVAGTHDVLGIAR